MSEHLLAVNFDSLPDISLGTAALLIFAIVASLSMLRGLIRILWGSIVIATAGLAAFFTWQYVPTIQQEWIGKDISWLPYALPCVAFIFVAITLRFIARKVLYPNGEPVQDNYQKPKASLFRWIWTMMFSIIPAAILCIAGAVILHHFGSAAELRQYAEQIGNEATSEETRNSFLVRMKQSLDGKIPDEWVERIDPVTSDARLKLAKLIAVADSAPPKAIPVLEEPEIRDLILSDPELRELARQGRYSEILRDPRLDRLLENENLREVLANTDL